MSRSHATRTARSFGVFFVTVTTLPICLGACATAPALQTPTAELRADSSSELLSVQPERLYRVSEVEILSPTEQASVSEAVEDDVSPSGFLVVHDGVITEAELSLSIAEFPEASFVMTEPTILRREGHSEGVVNATGTLSVNGFEQRGTTVTLNPRAMTDTTASFDVTFKVPSSVLLITGNASMTEVSAHVEFTAE